MIVSKCIYFSQQLLGKFLTLWSIAVIPFSETACTSNYLITIKAYSGNYFFSSVKPILIAIKSCIWHGNHFIELKKLDFIKNK